MKKIISLLIISLIVITSTFLVVSCDFPRTAVEKKSDKINLKDIIKETNLEEISNNQVQTILDKVKEKNIELFVEEVIVETITDKKAKISVKPLSEIYNNGGSVDVFFSLKKYNISQIEIELVENMTKDEAEKIIKTELEKVISDNDSIRYMQNQFNKLTSNIDYKIDFSKKALNEENKLVADQIVTITALDSSKWIIGENKVIINQKK